MKHSSKLAVEHEGDIFYINPGDILYITREEKTSKIVTMEYAYEIKTPIKELQARFSSYPFFRIHKSFLMHLDYVRKLTPWFNGAYQLELKERDEVLPVSRNYVKELRQRLEL
ncbi:LytTR family DNA-binding domain-containing protein [Domibacillus indicus]|uniref:LytTR family DNA-binding domain-containing protein n=1 Tax=Domibacillus indicus TaxID=1437523 RepID=UPI000B13D33B